jgi:hypothetical protein
MADRGQDQIGGIAINQIELNRSLGYTDLHTPPNKLTSTDDVREPRDDLA